MKKELKKLLKRLLVGAVVATTIISTKSVNPAYAATTDNPDNFQIIYQTQTQKLPSIYRVAKEDYMDRPATPTDQGGFYTASEESYNKYVLSGGWVENFYEIYCAINTKKAAYNLMYSISDIKGIDEAPKALRYFLCGGADPLEAHDYNYCADDTGKISNYKVETRSEIDQKIKQEQGDLVTRYKGIDFSGYKLNDLDINSTNTFESRLYLIDMDNLLNQSSSAAGYYKTNLKDLSNYILQNKDQIPTNGSPVQIETKGNGIIVVKDDTNLDWSSTLGEAFGDMLCKVSKQNNNLYYEVELNYCLQDMYKWPATRTFYGIQETDLNKLHLIGLSQDFRMFGSFKETIRVYPDGQIMCKDPNSDTYISIYNRTNYKSNI